MFGSKTSSKTNLINTTDFRSDISRGAGEACGGLLVGALFGALTAAVLATVSYFESREQAEDAGPTPQAQTPQAEAVSPLAC